MGRTSKKDDNAEQERKMNMRRLVYIDDHFRTELLCEFQANLTEVEWVHLGLAYCLGKSRYSDIFWDNRTQGYRYITAIEEKLRSAARSLGFAVDSRREGRAA